MVTKAVEEVLSACKYRENPYFVNLRGGDFSKEDFIETQIQFAWAVFFFPRPMAALVGKIPRGQLRVEIIRNLFEEHGEGASEKFHAHTFRELLSRLGVSEAEFNKRALWPEVRCFNTTLAGACVLDEWLIGTAIMGIIERMFVDISNWLAEGIVARGWLPREKMTHYNLHEELDVKHAQDFFEVLQPSWDKGPQERYGIQQGLLLGAYVFNGLYEGLYLARKRRLFVEPGYPPHVF